MKRVGQYIPNPLRRYKCQKYGYYDDNCRRWKVWGNFGQHKPDHHTNECEFPYKCANCGVEHLVYGRSRKSGELEKEILAIKHEIPYYGAQKMVAEFQTSTHFQTVQ